MTRSLIQFGQGAIRSHPYLLKEMTALEDPDRARGLEQFDRDVLGAMSRTASPMRCAPGAAPGPAACLRRRRRRATASRFYRPLGRYASAFALAVDVALLSLGGALKRQEMISARFGDMLSELYLLSAVLKRWEDEGRQEADLPLVAWCMDKGLRHHRDQRSTRFSRISPTARRRGCCAFCLLPFGARRRGPSDRLTQACAEILLEPLGRARPPHRGYLPRHRRRRGRAARARLRAHGRGRSRCASACARRTCATSTRRGARR